MNKNTHYKKVVVFLAIITLFAGASAYAQDAGNNGGHPGGPMAWVRGLFGGERPPHPQNGGAEFDASSTRPLPPGMRGMMGRGRDNASSTRGEWATSTRPVRGGMMGSRPFVGTVVSVSGTSFTATGLNKATFTIDASNAKIITRGTTPTSTPTTLTVGDLTAGENVAVVGQVSTSTSSIVATQVYAGIRIALPQGGDASNTQDDNGGQPRPNFLQKVGNFFGHLFGR